MPLPTKPLDDRSFQDLVDEAKKRIPLYCPEWTDHNVSDPGVTLIELFAWMMDTLLYRLNQVPHNHYVKLLELLGIRLQAPQAASVPLTFYLSAPQGQIVTVPKATVASTSRAEGDEMISFSTDEALEIRPAELAYLVTRQQAEGGPSYQNIPLQRLEREFAVFSPETPRVGDAFYLGFEAPLYRHYLGIQMDCLRAGGLNIIPESPPLLWEAWTESGWAGVDVEQDTTGGLSWTGEVRLHLPILEARQVSGNEAHWLRCRVVEPGPEQRPYATSPVLRNVVLNTWGATVDATHANEVREEPLGRSDGSPGQVFRLEYGPVLPRREDERIELWRPGLEEWQSWSEVDHFGDSGPEDRHYTLDSASGEIRFGPALRCPDGTVERYGAVPPRGADIRFSRYRYGGGTGGNVRQDAITELKSAIAYVDHVTNREPAQGGLDQETLPRAMFRAQNLLRTRYRAVTPSDYEYVTREAFPGQVARVRCLQTRLEAEQGRPIPGQVYVIVIPQLPKEEAQGYIPLSRLALDDDLRRAIGAHLNERRLLTTELQVRQAGYKRVRVQAQVAARPGVDERRLERDIMAALHGFVNPLLGGPEGTGWPFGRELYLSDLYVCVQQVEGLMNVQNIDMYWLDEDDVAHQAQRSIDLLAHEVFVSDIHRVDVRSE